MNEFIETRKSLIKNCHRIIVKAGTRLLTDRLRIAALVDGIADLRARGFQVLLVTSGAVGMGMKVLNLKRRPRKLAEVQALAAIGQGKLMEIYEAECARHNLKIAQLLLTASDLRSRKRFLNVMNCINALWENQVLPIVNENDSVSVDELKFGDNDILSAMLGALTAAELTVILTTESGLRQNIDGNLGERISIVPKLTAEIFGMAKGTDDADFSIGGMSSKLNAAKLLGAAGSHLWIADGRIEGILTRIAEGEDVGTLFLPSVKKLHSRKVWISFFSKCSGRISVDSGAAKAVKSHGKSLLPSGVKAIEGRFKRGDTVEIIGPDKMIIGRGLVNFDADECEVIREHQSKDLSQILKRDADEEIIHRDNLVLCNQL